MPEAGGRGGGGGAGADSARGDLAQTWVRAAIGAVESHQPALRAPRLVPRAGEALPGLWLSLGGGCEKVPNGGFPRP